MVVEEHMLACKIRCQQASVGRADAAALATAGSCVWSFDLFANLKSEPRESPLQAVAECVDTGVLASTVFA